MYITSFIIALAKFALGISIIVAIHELGHMLFAKFFGMRVEQYMIGFPPKVASIQWGETEYGVGAIPIGGAVKIAGMLDESMDTTHLAQGVQPWEFRSKPVWQRLLVMLGGILFNLISASLIYTCLLLIAGSTYWPKEAINKHGICPTELGARIGLQRGDRVTRINGRDFTKFSEVHNALNDMSKPAYYTVLRNGSTLRIKVPIATLVQIKKKNTLLMYPLMPFRVGKVLPGSSAAAAGLQYGDELVAIDNHPTPYLQDLENVLKGYKKKSITLQYRRAGILHTTTVAIDTTGKPGFAPKPNLAKAHLSYTLAQATVSSIYMIGHIMALQAKGISYLITRKVSFSDSISGPVGIAKLFGDTSNIHDFWWLIAFLSVLIAFINLLPIPALDGGHATLLLYEMITRHSLSDRWRMRLQIVGMCLLLGLMVLGLLNDLLKLWNTS